MAGAWGVGGVGGGSGGRRKRRGGPRFEVPAAEDGFEAEIDAAFEAALREGHARGTFTAPGRPGGAAPRSSGPADSDSDSGSASDASESGSEDEDALGEDLASLRRAFEATATATAGPPGASLSSSQAAASQLDEVVARLEAAEAADDDAQRFVALVLAAKCLRGDDARGTRRVHAAAGGLAFVGRLLEGALAVGDGPHAAEARRAARQLGVRVLGAFLCVDDLAGGAEAVPLARAALRAAEAEAEAEAQADRIAEAEAEAGGPDPGVVQDAAEAACCALAAVMTRGGGVRSDVAGCAAGMAASMASLLAQWAHVGPPPQSDEADAAAGARNPLGALVRGLALATTVGVGEGEGGGGIAVAAAAAVAPLCGLLRASAGRKATAAFALDVLQALAVALPVAAADEGAAGRLLARARWAGEARDALAVLLRSRLDVGHRDAALRCCWALAGMHAGGVGDGPHHHWLCGGDGSGALLVLAARVGAVEAKVMMHMLAGGGQGDALGDAAERIRMLLPVVLHLLALAVDAVAAAMEGLDEGTPLVSEACIDKAFPALQDAAGTCAEYLAHVLATGGAQDAVAPGEEDVPAAACAFLGAYAREVQGEHDAALARLRPLYRRLGVPSPLDDDDDDRLS